MDVERKHEEEKWSRRLRDFGEVQVELERMFQGRGILSYKQGHSIRDVTAPLLDLRFRKDWLKLFPSPG